MCMSREELLEAMEMLKEIVERDVIYTGGFRFYGNAVIAEIVCKKCQREFWANYTHPKSLCFDCGDECSPYRLTGTGKISEAVDAVNHQYHGSGEF